MNWKLLAITFLLATLLRSHAAEKTWKDAVLEPERLRLDGDLETAAVALERLIRETTPADGTETLVAYHKLGLLYQAVRRFNDAERCYRRALGMSERLPEFDVGVHARILNNLTGLYLETRQHSRVDINRLRHVAAQLETESPDNIDLAWTYVGTGEVCAFYKRYAEAESQFRRALQLFRQKGELLDAANTLGSLGAVRSEAGDNGDALRFYREAMAILDGADRTDPQARIRLLSNIAVAHSRMRHPEDAFLYVHRAVSLSETVFGSDHPLAAMVLRNYAAVLRQLKKKPEAKSAERRANAILARYARQSHLNAVVDVHDLAVLPSRR